MPVDHNTIVGKHIQQNCTTAHTLNSRPDDPMFIYNKYKIQCTALNPERLAWNATSRMQYRSSLPSQRFRKVLPSSPVSPGNLPQVRKDIQESLFHHLQLIRPLQSERSLVDGKSPDLAPCGTIPQLLHPRISSFE